MDDNEVIKRQKQANDRLVKLIDVVVNKILRQTIAGKTHSERNRELRQIARDMLHIVEIANDEYPPNEIPF